MKRKNKNLLTLALATLIVGAGVGAVATINKFPATEAIYAKADDAYVDDVTDCITITKVDMNAAYRSRYDVVISFDNVAFNTAMFYTNQYPNSEQIGVKITDYIAINGQTLTEIHTKYTPDDARKEWIKDLEDGDVDKTANMTSNEDWGFNKTWVPVVGQINTNNVTLMIDRRFATPTDLKLTIKSGLEIPYTDAKGKATILKVSEDVTFTLVPNTNNVEGLVGVRVDESKVVETEANEIALVRVAETDKNVQYQLHTDLLFSSGYKAGTWTADHYMYLNDYFTINGETFSKWNKETYLAEYTTGAINSTAYQYSVPLLNVLHSRSTITNDSGTIFQFYISKAWMTAMNIDENTMTLGIREGLTYINADGKVAKTTNALSYQKTFTATVSIDGAESKVVYTASNRAEKLAEIAAKLPQDTAEYTYAWSESLPTELPFEDGKTYVATKTAVEYTATLDYIEGEDSTLTYTVENRAEKLAALIKEAQDKSDAQYAYSWDLPEELPLENGKTYTEKKTAAEYSVTFKADGEQVGEEVKFTADTKADLKFPEVPEKEGYTAAWDTTVADVTEWKNYTVNAVYTAIEYTATVVVDGATENVTYTIENRAEKLAEIAAKIPTDTDEYTYDWTEKLPETLPLENGKTYTVVKTEKPVSPDSSDSSDVPDVSSPDDTSSSEVSSPDETSSSEVSSPDDSCSSEVSSPDETSSSEVSSPDETSSSEVSSPDETSSSEVSSPDNTTSSIQTSESSDSGKKSGCSGALSGLSAGVLAFGAVAVLLKKKKEDK